MTKLNELMEAGYAVMISDMATIGSPFYSLDWGDESSRPTLVFHTLDYNQIAYDDIFEWHELNMGWVYDRIDRQAKNAEARLNKMVDDLNEKHKPHRIVQFHGPMFVEEIHQEENGEITFNFSSAPPIDKADAKRYALAFEREKERGTSYV